MIYKIRNKEIEINVGDKILFNGSVYWMHTNNTYTPLTKNVISKLNLKWDKDVIGILGTKLEQFKVLEWFKMIYLIVLSLVIEIMVFFKLNQIEKYINKILNKNGGIK